MNGREHSTKKCKTGEFAYYASQQKKGSIECEGEREKGAKRLNGPDGELGGKGG